ncbi:hypothetical protein J2T57_002694 [Natronocella acetinitrilica]|jgi:hypothetical protein|uniref:Uncharacterized protein n=1 Tax=Natronocella acetinitrilica TaxID=414046 RepID=A0AAE3KCA1_9GAMM|nr:hypothetical protein [Natronocella acetinitrilica]MCP1675544.1 hypothetical protein [Natronocella acetinitrilica]
MQRLLIIVGVALLLGAGSVLAGNEVEFVYHDGRHVATEIELED